MTTEKNKVNMVLQEDSTPVTMEGYLEKRGKMKLVSTWKRYWFVLKGQLLLYYKTQHECNNLSVCRGSLNMGLASCVRPGANRGPPANGTQGYTIEVVTRTQVITLRTKDRTLQEQWLKALLESMALPISTPIRNSTGPMHFRYSLDNLPVIEEAESEDKNKEKQSTLPKNASISRRESILGHIKKIGGTSYGGSLETIIKRQQKSQQLSPLQPKIPRIKAIDRMLGIHQTSEESEEEEDLSEEEKQDLINDKDTSVSKSNYQNGMLKNYECVNDSKIKSDFSNSDGELQIIASGATSKKSESEEINLKNLGYSEIIKNKNKNSRNVDLGKLEDTKNLTWNMVENEKQLSCVESKDTIVVENKLYDKSLKTRNEDKNVKSSNEETAQTTEINVDKKVEEKAKRDKENGSKRDTCEYFEVGKIKDVEKQYEEVKVTTEIVNQIENTEYDEEEEEYYSQYDKFSLLNSLSDKEKEPTLPPRPSVSSNASNELVKSQNQNNVMKEDDYVEYSYLYETTLNTTTSNSKIESSGGESTPRKKKKYKLHKLRSKKKKSPGTESVDSEDGQKNESMKKKRKMSFLRHMLKHYRKKTGSQVTTDEAEDSEDPEYERVDYSAAFRAQMDRENDQTDSIPSEVESTGGSTEKDIQKERIFGTNLLSEQGMKELKMKLRVRDDSADRDTASRTTVLQDKEEKECIISDDVRDRKPVPTPRPSKQKPDQLTGSFTDTKQCINESLDRPNIPPKLPPRKVGRPPSPCHDVPKNNSPIYGNFDDLNIAMAQKNEKKAEELPRKHSEAKIGEWDEDIQDDLLGTPLGFAYIQNKWKAAERSGELNSKGKVSPGKNRSSEEYKGKHTRNSSSSSVGKSSIKSDFSDAEQNCSTSEVYTEIQRLRAKSIIKNINSQSNRNVETNGPLSKITNEHKGDSEFSKVKNDDINKISKISEVRSESVKTDTCVKCNNVESSDFSIESAVTLRRPQEHYQKTELNHNQSLSSSHDSSKDLRGEFRSRSDSSTQTSQISFPDSLNNEYTGDGMDSEDYDLMPRLNRHSDELNLLLAQLAEITSAPLLPQNVAISLSDIPESRKSKLQIEKSPEASQSQPEQFVLGPIRRRRHSDPDYDVPRPHGSLLQLLAANRASNRSSQSQSGHESDVIEATHFFGDQRLMINSGRSSLSLRHSVISEVDNQSETSYYISMAPDSLEVTQVKDVESVYS